MSSPIKSTLDDYASAFELAPSASGERRRPYRYEPFDSATGALKLRLIKICPARTADQIPHCTLTVATLSRDLRYRALSYTWGSPDDIAEIRVDGLVLFVRRNLYDFLDFAQRVHDLCEIWLWIDQICICQSDVVERNHAVAQMDRIFSYASQTIIWLGLNLILGHIFVPPDMWAQPHDTLLEAFLRVNYWIRLWIIQEIILSKDIIVLSALGTATWSQIEKHMLQNSRVYSEHQAWHLMLNRKKALSNPNQQLRIRNWTEATLLTQTSKCERKQDRIYGMLGLIHPSIRVEVNYQNSIEKVFVDVLFMEMQKAKPRERKSLMHRVFADHLADILELDREIATISISLVLAVAVVARRHLIWLSKKRTLVELINMMFQQSRNVRLRNPWENGDASPVYELSFFREYRKLLGLVDIDFLDDVNITSAIVKRTIVKDHYFIEYIELRPSSQHVTGSSGEEALENSKWRVRKLLEHDPTRKLLLASSEMFLSLSLYGNILQS